MNQRGIVYAVAALAVVLSWGPPVANAEDAAPKGNKGFTVSKTTTVDLGPEIEGMNGRQLRLRVLTNRAGWSHRHT